jgi:hypothetical protein
MKFYPVADRLERADREALGLTNQETRGPLPSVGQPATVTGQNRDVKAVYAGEKRPPRAGEWYLSGARPAAYRAPNDLSSAYHIARLVLTETETVTRIKVITG